jgi:hypothetical protein
MKLRNLFCFIATVTIFAAVTLIGRMQWVLCMDRHGPAMGLAELEVLNAERETPIEIRQTRYLKTSSSRATARSSSELVLALCSRILLGGVEVMRIIAKGQMKHITAPRQKLPPSSFISW